MSILTTDTLANWEEKNPILLDGEISLERETGEMKIGDGLTKWSSLRRIPTMKYRSYTAYLTQVAAAPVAVVLDDTITKPVWAKTAVGTFTLTKVGAFVVGKTVPVKDHFIDEIGNKYTFERTSADIMTLKTYAAVDTEVLADGVLTNQYIHLEIYL